MGKYAYRIVGFALAGLLPSIVFGAGLGRLTVLSSLGQPLKAEIEIVSVQPGEAESLSAALAPQDAFRQANVELNGVLFDVRFAILRRQNGQYAVVLSSTRPLNEPFLDMLVELKGSSGRLVREYTFLLDPPEYKGSAVASAAVPVAPPTAQPLPSEKPATAEGAPSVRPDAPASAAGPKAPGSYEVKPGDTLGKIARQTAPQGVSLHQMLVALYRGNEEAFITSNMNRLRAGRILNIPDRDTALSVSAEDARRLVTSHSSAYADYRRSIGAAAAAAPARAEGTRQASGRITTGEEEKPAAPKEAPRDQLRLSKPDDIKAGGRAGQAATADDAVAKDKALKEAQERVAALEKNVADLQKLLTLKSAAGAQAQQQAGAAKATPPAQPKVETAKAGNEVSAPGPVQAAKPQTIGEASQSVPPQGAKAPDAGKAKPAAKAPIKAAPPPPEPSLLDELLDNPYAVGGIALVIVLLIGYALYAWRRKKQAAEHRFGPSFLGQGSLAPASSVLGMAGGQSVDTGTSSLQMDFSTGAHASKAQAEEIDPVAEADVYMAYGRDAQAEEILKEALAKDPARNAVRLKLLEIYGNRKDAKAFEAIARELHSSTGAQGPDWEKVAVLGRQIDPSNKLYGGSGEAVAQQAPAPGAPAASGTRVKEPAVAPPLDIDLDLDVKTEPAVPDIDLDAPVTAAADQPITIDFDLDLGGEKAPSANKAQALSPDATVALSRAERQPEAAPAGLDFDLGLGDLPATPVAQAEVSSKGGLDFDFNLDDLAPAAAAAPEHAPAIDLSAITLDLGEPPAAPASLDAKWQEVATKLDLAKAYEEMGDKDGARDLLNEVVKEGDTAQQEQAKSLLATLA